MFQIQSYCYVIRCYAYFEILFILFCRRMDSVNEGTQEQLEQTGRATQETQDTEEQLEQTEESTTETQDTQEQLEQTEEGTTETQDIQEQLEQTEDTKEHIEEHQEPTEKEDEGEEEDNRDDTAISLPNTPSVSSVSFSVSSSLAGTESLPKKILTSLDDYQLIIY